MHRSLKTVLLGLALALSVAAPAAAASSPTAQSVIVKYRSAAGSAAVGALAQRLGVGTQIGSIRHSSASVFAVAGDPAAVAARLERSSLVSYAEPNLILRADAIPNDPMFGQLYGLNNTGQTGGTPDADIDAPEGWDAAGLGAFPATGGVKVGVVDTGIQAAHPDLAGSLANCAQSIGLIPGVTSGSIKVGSCADDNGHGTHVSGTITANANNGIGVTGVSFNSPLAMCRALSGPAGVGTTADVANCITWDYDQGAKVISMSLGGGASTTLQNAVNYAWKGGAANGAVLVAAAGNDGDATLNYPAAYPNVVSVAATDNRDQRASFSNANADVEVAAPGVNITSTWNDGTYNTISGTSMATPHVAGVTALIRSRYPSATAAQIVAKLDGAVDDLGAAGRDPNFGFGRVNLLQAATE
ncbi:MAG: thermitase [Solirubrobacterales bacterium]|jgi:thermitase|nr:thermitase [Solirubrobacterales bacterium]